MIYEAEVYIALKKTVADPQGQTIKHALGSLGFPEVKHVRTGKMLTLTVDAANSEEAGQKLDSMCRKLLANPIIEEFRFSVKEA